MMLTIEFIFFSYLVSEKKTMKTMKMNVASMGTNKIRTYVEYKDKLVSCMRPNKIQIKTISRVTLSKTLFMLFSLVKFKFDFSLTLRIPEHIGLLTFAECRLDFSSDLCICFVQMGVGSFYPRAENLLLCVNFDPICTASRPSGSILPCLNKSCFSPGIRVVCQGNNRMVFLNKLAYAK